MVPAWLQLLCLFIPQAFPGAQPAEVYVDVPENYGGNFPLYLTKLPLPRKETEGQIVLSGDSGVAAEGPFAVDPESGFLLVTRALDREEQAEYQLQVTLETEDGRVLWGPQHVLVHVKDENDQVPHFSQAIYKVQLSQGTRPGVPFFFLEASDGDAPGTANSDLRFHILNQAPSQPSADMFQLEPQLGALALSPEGTKVAKLSVEDADAPGSPNSHIVYRLLSPEPEEAAEGRVFELDSTSGSVTLGAAPLQAGQNILLQVLVIDLGGAEGGLSSTCEIAVMITDINDHAPEFTTSQIEPLSLPEDTEPGTLVTTLMATDADLEPAFRLMDFAIEAGDVEGTFGLDWEPDSGHVLLRLLKNLSYEAAPSHKLVVVVRSVAEPVGPDPGPGATVTVTVLVERVVPPPQLDQESYEASVPVSTPAGSLLLTIRPSDPMSSPLRFSLVNDSEGWLCIEEVSGEVHIARALQGAQPGDMYTVLVEAQDADEPTLSTSVALVIHFLKAPSAPIPTLAPEPSQHLCTPRQDRGVVVGGPRGDPDLAGGHGPYSFALGPNPTAQRDWRLRALNGSHAYLTLGLHWVEPREHVVPIVVSHHDRVWQIQVPVIVCRCNVEGQCMRKVGRMKGMPTKLSAVGILVGTLIAIGIFLILIFTHLTLARKKDPDQPVDSVPLKAAV
ncbi:PREDICTED: cadherin-16 isoform X2 [Lipotes vexillifer]|uniref:Cadherin-16 isoform X2 n=1 Tax=Lipotes vexillifer TaxID=118797 RepID=A0A340XBB9_LIPVE|nr:PREDICTED: cadherin-16 isoform X2 [Lipotes vexillifer]